MGKLQMIDSEIFSEVFLVLFIFEFQSDVLELL